MLVRHANGTVRLFPAVGEVTAAALAFGLPGDPGREPGETAWRTDAATLVAHRLSGLALAAARTHGWSIPADVESTLRVVHRRETLTSLRNEAAARAVIERLTAADVSALVVKGPGTARAYPAPSQRPFRDVDVLVQPSQFARAMRIVRGLEYGESARDFQPRSFFDRVCREGVNLMSREGSVDLHHHVPPWIWGRRLRFADLWGSSVTLPLGGGHVRGASPVHNLLVSSLHVLSDKGRPGQELLIWRDVASLAAVCDPAEAAAAAREAGLDWWLRRVASELPEAMRPGALLDALGRARPGVVDGFRLRRLLPPGLGSRHQIAQAFRLPVPNALAFLAGYTIPSRRFLKVRYGSEGSYRRWWSDAGHRIQAAAHVQEKSVEMSGDRA